MPKPELEQTVRPSVIDRLIDNEPRQRSDPPVRFSESVNNLKSALRRDLEWLLNTRRIADPAPEELEEVNRSVYHFGVPDITSMSRGSLDARSRLLRSIHESISLFEPRLIEVRVSPVEGEGDSLRREIRFLIEAMLRMEPDPEPVIFDTVLELSNGEYEVRGDTHA